MKVRSQAKLWHTSSRGPRLRFYGIAHMPKEFSKTWYSVTNLNRHYASVWNAFVVLGMHANFSESPEQKLPLSYELRNVSCGTSGKVAI